MDLAETIIKLCSLSGPSGFEGEVSAAALELLAQYCGETYTDVMGNAVGVIRCGRENAPRVLLDAHIDEIGFIITACENGFLKFSQIGGVDGRMLPASEVKLLTQPPVYGVIDTMPPHVLTQEERSKALRADTLTIDTGMTQQQCEKAVPLGTAAVYAGTCERLGEKSLCGKALDDRAGFAVLLKALEYLKGEQLRCDLYVMGSTQEEVGLRGACTGAYAIAPDYCIVVDVGHAKTPDSSGVYHTMGGGVMIGVGPNMNRELTQRAIALADECGIKYQIEADGSGNSGTNARVVQVAGEGAATALFSIPLKYMHTPREVIGLDDCDSTARLTAALVRDIKGACEA